MFQIFTILVNQPIHNFELQKSIIKCGFIFSKAFYMYGFITKYLISNQVPIDFLKIICFAMFINAYTLLHV
jgi:hypothetical protein